MMWLVVSQNETFRDNEKRRFPRKPDEENQPLSIKSIIISY